MTCVCLLCETIDAHSTDIFFRHRTCSPHRIIIYIGGRCCSSGRQATHNFQKEQEVITQERGVGSVLARRVVQSDIQTPKDTVDYSTIPIVTPIIFLLMDV